MNRTLRLVFLNEIPEDPELRRQWNELVLACDRPQVFYTYEWALAVYRAYRETLSPLVVLGYEGERLQAIAALGVDSGGSVSFLCANTADYCDVIASPEYVREFISQVLAELRRRGLRRVTLTNLPADSATLRALREASRENEYHLFARTAYDCAQTSLSELRARSAGGNLELPRKKMVRRSKKALGRDAPLRLEHIETAEAIEPVLRPFIESHVARFLATGRISNLARPERQVFLAELSKLLSQPGWLKLSLLVSGDKVYAWNNGFNFEGTWFWYQPTFDDDFEKFSPGYCLLYDIVQEAAKTPSVNVVDLGLGAEGYKEYFANSARKTFYVTLRASIATHVQEALRHAAARAVHASPKMERAVRRFTDHWQRLRREGISASCSRIAERVRAFVSSNDEVLFFDGCQARTANVDGELHAVNLKSLARALIQNIDDASTCAYLLRCAVRLREDGMQGFALLDRSGAFLHLAWVTRFAGFHLAELNAKVESPGPDCAMLFDCWTPTKMRGHGYYGQTVALIAKLMREQGKEPWIFSASTNRASISGLGKAGFQRRYSLVRKRLFGFQWIEGNTPKQTPRVAAEVSASV